MERGITHAQIVMNPPPKIMVDVHRVGKQLFIKQQFSSRLLSVGEKREI